MNKKGQLQILLNPRSMVFIFGGAILGFVISNSVKGAIIGAIIGVAISFFV